MKTVTFWILTDFLSEIFESVQVEKVEDWYEVAKKKFPTAVRITYDGWFHTSDILVSPNDDDLDHNKEYR